MELHLKIAGILIILLSSIHIPFPNYFKWRDELPKLSLINRQMMYSHTFFLAFLLFLMGLMSVWYTDDIIHTRLGRSFALGMGVFWLLRLLAQFFWYSSELWKGKRFETVIHIVFSILWVYFSVTYFMVYYWVG